MSLTFNSNLRYVNLAKTLRASFLVIAVMLLEIILMKFITYTKKDPDILQYVKVKKEENKNHSSVDYPNRKER